MVVEVDPTVVEEAVPMAVAETAVVEVDSVVVVAAAGGSVADARMISKSRNIKTLHIY